MSPHPAPPAAARRASAATAVVLTAWLLMLALAAGVADARRFHHADAPPRHLVPADLVLVPPPTGMYHAAYPDFAGTEDRVAAWRVREFERLAGRRLAWVYFSDNWTRGIRFPARNAGIVRDMGRLPFIRLMARSDFDGGADRVYRLQRIIDGRFDGELRQWFREAAAFDSPLVCEFGTEVNGDWFPWNGRWNGAGTRDGFGDPAVPDGPERFVAAYRRLVEMSREAGAANITWVYHVNADSWPRRSWNTIAAYYPGDAYVDWIGVSVYGGLAPGQYWGSFRELLDAAYPELAALSPHKPLAVLEWGISQRPGRVSKAQWIANALRNLRNRRWPRVAAAAYWHEDWRNGDGTRSDLRIDSSPAVRRAYRRGIAGPSFVAAPVYSVR